MDATNPKVGERVRIKRHKLAFGRTIESLDFADVKEVMADGMLLVCFLGESEDVIVPKSDIAKIAGYGAGRFTLPGSPAFSPALGSRPSGKGWRKK